MIQDKIKLLRQLAKDASANERAIIFAKIEALEIKLHTLDNG